MTQISKDIEESIIKLYESFFSSTEIEKLIGVSDSSIIKILKKNNIPIRRYSDYYFLNKEKELEIINFYNLNKSIKECSLHFKYCENTIRNLLKRNNIKYTNKKLDINNIILLYKSGKTIREIQKIYNCSYNSIWIKIRQIKNNFDLSNNRNDKKIHNVNENYFDNINTLDKAYFLGLLVADGCNTGSGFTITLKESDCLILETFQKYINYSGQIKKINEKVIYDKYLRKSQKRLTIYSNKLSKSLEKLNVVKNKTFITCFPNIPEKFHSHFIRGVFDGDGCIYIDKYKSGNFSICGTFKLLEKIQEILIKECDLTKTKLSKSKNTFVLNYSKKEHIYSIYNYLYKDCGDLYLKRKKEKFEECKMK